MNRKWSVGAIFTLIICLLFVLAVTTFGSGAPTPEASLNVPRSQDESATVAQADAPLQESAAERVPVEIPLQTGSEFCTGSAVQAYRYYYAQLCALPTVSERDLELIKPVHAILQLPKETRSLLAATDPKEDEIGALKDAAGKSAGISKRLMYFLLDRWTKHAAAIGEDLCSAVIDTLVNQTNPTLAEADGPTLKFIASALSYVTPQDTVKVMDAALSALNTLDALPRERFASRNIDAMLNVLINVAYQKPSETIRSSLLALLGRPWMTDARTASFVVKLTMIADFSQWRGDLLILSTAPEAAKRWAAVEALRIFAANNSATPSEVNALVSDSLLRDADRTTQWAAVELLAAFGGPEGVARLLGELDSPLAPDKSGILSFLSHKNKLPVSIAAQYVTSKDVNMRDAAIDALGHLGKTTDEAVTILRGHLTSDSAEVRQLVVRALALTNRPEVARLLATAVRDQDQSVAKEVVKQIGRLKEAQPETLSTLADDRSLPGEVRALAYEELLMDSNDKDVPTVFEKMWSDSDPVVQESGYFGKASLAFASGDPAMIEQWRALPLPAKVVERAGLLGVFQGSVRSEVEKNVQALVTQLQDPLAQEAMAQHSAMLTGALEGNSILSERFRIPQRMASFVKKR